MSPQQAHVHHYVPKWYQRRFLRPGERTFYYLDLHPETVNKQGRTYQRRQLLRWSPTRCFYMDDLYTFKLGKLTTDEIETRFFGVIDTRGRQAVGVFGDYTGFSKRVHEAFPILPQYMDAQRSRTPRGLAQLKALTKAPDHNRTLLAMQALFQMHTTMWTEGVWELVRARKSPTKFIVSDEPVTFFNRRLFPSEYVYPGAIELDKVGTRTIFPLGLDACLIVTHTQFVRNPWAKPTETRVNARAYQPTLRKTSDTQFGRELEEDEVLRINFILKKRATRYIAAPERQWLYPEERVSTTEWPTLDDDWFLLPNPYKIHFTTGIAVGYRDGSAWAIDEYGRAVTHPKYQDKRQHDKEWVTHIRAQQEWARKRRGRSVAHVDNTSRDDDVGDKLMNEYLAQEDARSAP